MPIHAKVASLVTKGGPKTVGPKLVTKATRKPRRGLWPPDPARVRSLLDGLEELYPDVDCELDRE